MSDFEDLDEAEKERRKKEQVEFRNKKRNSNLFILACSVFEILETLAILFVLLILWTLIVSKTLATNENLGPLIYQIGLLVIFIGGFILGFIVYRKIVQWAIKKFNLEGKILDSVLVHYKKQSKEEMEKEMRK